MAETGLQNGNSPVKSEETSVDVPNEVPVDDYCLVGWDLDTTGRKLLDEICHIAGYTPNDNFSLYIMPHGDLNNIAKKRHMIRIVTVGVYRIIKDTANNKVKYWTSKLGPDLLSFSAVYSDGKYCLTWNFIGGFDTV